MIIKVLIFIFIFFYHSFSFANFFLKFWQSSNSSVELGISDFVPYRNPKILNEESANLIISQQALSRKDEVPFPFIASGLKISFLKTKKKISLGFSYEYQN